MPEVLSHFEVFLRRDKAVRVSHAIDIREQSVFILGFGRLDKLSQSHDFSAKRQFVSHPAHHPAWNGVLQAHQTFAYSADPTH